jgi:alkylation response protein AidB-like acyl-CoA dehydrogenase
VIAFANRAAEVAAIAAQHADDVDREARFPHETLAALKDARLLSILIPEELGGESASLSDVAEICSLIGQNCASSAHSPRLGRVAGFRAGARPLCRRALCDPAGTPAK